MLAAACDICTEADRQLLSRYSQLCVSPASLGRREDAVMWTTSGPLYRFTDEKVGTGPATPLSLMGVADTVVALWTRAHEKYPTPLQQQQWVASFVLAAAYKSLAGRPSSSLRLSHGLSEVGFNPFACPLLMQYGLSVVCPAVPWLDGVALGTSAKESVDVTTTRPASTMTPPVLRPTYTRILSDMGEALARILCYHPGVRRQPHTGLSWSPPTPDAVPASSLYLAGLQPLVELHTATQMVASECGASLFLHNLRKRKLLASPHFTQSDNDLTEVHLHPIDDDFVLQGSFLDTAAAQATGMLLKEALGYTRTQMDTALFHHWSTLSRGKRRVAPDEGRRGSEQRVPCLSQSRSRDPHEGTDRSVVDAALSPLVMWLQDCVNGLLFSYQKAPGSVGSSPHSDSQEGHTAQQTWVYFMHSYHLRAAVSRATVATATSTAAVPLPPLMSEEEYWYVRLLQNFLEVNGIHMHLALSLTGDEEDGFQEAPQPLRWEAATGCSDTSPLSKQDGPRGDRRTTDAILMSTSSSDGSSCSKTCGKPLVFAPTTTAAVTQNTSSSFSFPDSLHSSQRHAPPANTYSLGRSTHHMQRLLGREAKLTLSWPRAMQGGSLSWETMAHAWALGTLRSRQGQRTTAQPLPTTPGKDTREETHTLTGRKGKLQ